MLFGKLEERAPPWLKKRMYKEYLGNRHFTLAKLLSFLCVSGAGSGVFLTVTYILTEHFGLYFMWSNVIAGGFSYVIKYFLSGHWTFKITREDVDASNSNDTSSQRGADSGEGDTGGQDRSGARRIQPQRLSSM